jgi:hypothetical protein
MHARAEDVLKAMVKEGLLLSFKKGECIGSNSRCGREIHRPVEMHMKTISADFY